MEADGSRAAATTRARLGRFLLVAGGALVLASGFLPPGHPRTHVNELLSTGELFIDSVRAGIWEESTFVFLGLTVACALPIIAAGGFIAGGLIPEGRTRSLVCFVLHELALTAAALTLWGFFAMNVLDDAANRSLRLPFAGGGALTTILAQIEWRFYRRVSAGSAGWSDALHVVPAIILAIGGLVTGAIMRGTEHWHSADYLVLGAGALLVLGGVGMRGR